MFQIWAHKSQHCLCDIVEVGRLPNFVPEDEKTRYAFYLLSRQGLKFECSSTSEIQVTERYIQMQKAYKSDSL